jgi:Uncharacterized protein conserved in bacteria (DUF2252)
MPASGPSRHFVAARQLRRVGSKADTDFGGSRDAFPCACRTGLKFAPAAACRRALYLMAGKSWPALVDTIQDKETSKRLRKRLAAARERDVVEHDFPKLAEVVGQLPAIKDAPPLIFHRRKNGHERFTEGVKVAFAKYRHTLQEDRRQLLDHFELRDIAIKVVGVGSVGTWCGILLLLLCRSRASLFNRFRFSHRGIREASLSILLKQPNRGR